jgi:hypothetical protein
MLPHGSAFYGGRSMIDERFTCGFCGSPFPEDQLDENERVCHCVVCPGCLDKVAGSSGLCADCETMSAE